MPEQPFELMAITYWVAFVCHLQADADRAWREWIKKTDDGYRRIAGYEQYDGSLETGSRT